MNDCKEKEQESLTANDFIAIGLLYKEWQRQHEREMFSCEMHGKSCSYGICDECPLTNSEYGRSK